MLISTLAISKPVIIFVAFVLLPLLKKIESAPSRIPPRIIDEKKDTMTNNIIEYVVDPRFMILLGVFKAYVLFGIAFLSITSPLDYHILLTCDRYSLSLI